MLAARNLTRRAIATAPLAKHAPVAALRVFGGQERARSTAAADVPTEEVSTPARFVPTLEVIGSQIFTAHDDEASKIRLGRLRYGRQTLLGRHILSASAMQTTSPYSF